MNSSARHRCACSRGERRIKAVDVEGNLGGCAAGARGDFSSAAATPLRCTHGLVRAAKPQFSSFQVRSPICVDFAASTIPSRAAQRKHFRPGAENARRVRLDRCRDGAGTMRIQMTVAVVNDCKRVERVETEWESLQFCQLHGRCADGPRTEAAAATVRDRTVVRYAADHNVRTRQIPAVFPAQEAEWLRRRSSPRCALAVTMPERPDRRLWRARNLAGSSTPVLLPAQNRAHRQQHERCDNGDHQCR